MCELEGYERKEDKEQCCFNLTFFCFCFCFFSVPSFKGSFCFFFYLFLPKRKNKINLPSEKSRKWFQFSSSFEHKKIRWKREALLELLPVRATVGQPAATTSGAAEDGGARSTENDSLSLGEKEISMGEKEGRRGEGAGGGKGGGVIRLSSCQKTQVTIIIPKRIVNHKKGKEKDRENEEKKGK